MNGRIFVELPTEQVAGFVMEKDTNRLRSAYVVDDVSSVNSSKHFLGHSVCGSSQSVNLSQTVESKGG